MANICEHCKKPIPPGQEQCPHCTGADVKPGNVTDEAYQSLMEEEAATLDLDVKTETHGAMLSDLRLVDEALEPDSTPVTASPRKAKTPGQVASDSSTGLVEELVELGSGVNLDDDAPAERNPGRDLIAEAVEADSILDGVGEPHALDEGSSAVDLGSSSVIEVPQDGADAPARESSAVDLGSSAVIEIPQGVIDAALEADQADAAREGPARTASAPAPVWQPEDEAEVVSDLDELDERPRRTMAAVTDPEDDDRPVPQRGPRRFVHMGIGVGLGCILCLLLWAVGVEPPDALRLAGGSSPKPGTPPVQPQVKPVEDPLAQLNSGDLDRALTGLQSLDESKPENLAARGMAVWWQYVREQKRKHAPLKKDDEAVKEAIGYLTRAQEAKNADAVFWLAKIQEETGNVAEARKLYEQGSRDFPQERPWFQAQLDRTESAGRTESRLPAAGESEQDLALLVISLLAPGQPEKPDEPAKPPEEAGPEFFKALKLAQQNNYDAALQALQKARAIHDEQRFNRLRRAQNPLSDPTEEIFLRSCDELRTYWELRGHLNKSGYLAKQRDPVKALDAVLADLESANTQRKAEAAQRQAITAKLKQARFNDADPAKALDQLVSAYQAAQTSSAQAAVIAAKLKEAKLDEAEPDKAIDQLLQARAETQARLEKDEAKLKQINDKLAAAGIGKPEDAAVGVAELIASRTQADQALAAIAQKVAEVAKFPNSKPDAATVLRGVEQVVELAKTKSSQGPTASNERVIPRVVSESGPNPLLAAEHYAAGLNYFFSREYAQGEKQFAEAVRLESQDARYRYFLGLSRLQLNPGDRLALSDFQEAARLERMGQPARPAVNAALERVQGGLRQELDRFRP